VRKKIKIEIGEEEQEILTQRTQREEHRDRQRRV
jgi:hypothetical protein